MEQSDTVWTSSMTEENRNDLERIQKTPVKIILRDNFQNYDKALLQLDMENLNERRKAVCFSFCKKSCKSPKNIIYVFQE